MSHAREGGQAPDQASSGRQTGAAAHTQTDHSQGTHEAASRPTSHTRHGDNQAGNHPRQTNPTSLTVTQRNRGGHSSSWSAVAVAYRGRPVGR
jgi:hypothetical protein